MKIALICSHGGHLTEMLYLMNAFEGHDIFLVTYDHPRTRSLPYRKYLFPNFGKNPFKVIQYLPKIIKIILKEKPDIMISNGAEIAVPFFYFGKILGIKTIFIECYTRIKDPTVTGKLVYPISDYFFVLWPEMLQCYGKKAKYIGGLFKRVRKKVNLKEKKNQIFVITGTHYLGFDRLVRAVDNVAKDVSDDIIIQLGHTKYRPRNAKYFTFLDEDKEIRKLIQTSKLVISQGAISLIEALSLGSLVIAFPRLKKFKEHINDHQLLFSKKLEESGLVKVATNEDELKRVLTELLENSKIKLINSVMVNKRVTNILKEIVNKK